MKNNLEIIGIDHGWSHIKTKNHVFATGVEENVSPTFWDNVLEYNGRYYNIGGKRIEVADNKVGTDEFYMLTLAGIAMELKSRNLKDANVYLAAGLPLTRFGQEKAEFIKYLSRQSKVAFRYAEEDYHINIEKVAVFPQCYSAVAEMLASMPRKIAIVDIGSWTIDVMPVIDKRPDDQRCNSLPHGLITCMRDINRDCIKKLNVELDEKDIEHYIKYQNLPNVPADAIKLIDMKLREYSSMIMKSLRELGINPQTTPIIFVGGGAQVMKRYIGTANPNITYKTDVKANAKGYELLAKAAGR